MSDLDKYGLLLIWVIVNIFLAIIPVLISILFNSFFGLGIGWISILKESELFLFSTTLSAGSIGKILLPIPGEPDTDKKIALIYPQLSSDKIILLIALAVMLFISVIIFSANFLIKFSTPGFAVPDRRYAIGALGCAIVTALLSYVAFVQGGMK